MTEMKGLRTVNLLVQGWIVIMIGAVSIALGGVLTTFGWKKIDSHSRRRAVISGVAREWEINDVLLRKEALFNTSDTAVLGSYRLYPRFKSSAITNALGSGLLSPARPQEREMLRMLADYETTISDINARLGVSDNFVLSTRDCAAIAAHRTHVRTSPGMAGFIREHTKLKEYLERQYGWAIRQRFLD